MKKVLFVFVIAVAMVVSSTSNAMNVLNVDEMFGTCVTNVEENSGEAILGISFKVSWERGAKNEAGVCEGKGMCNFQLEFGSKAYSESDLNGASHSPDEKYAGFDGAGNFFVLVYNPKEDTYLGADFYFDKDFVIPVEFARQCGRTSYNVKKGAYRIQKDTRNNRVIISFPKA
ncbi:MAG: hypothetical protein ACKVOK_06060 [Flavobacteriales bacterium]